MKEKFLLLNIFSGGFYDLSPPQMLLAGSILLLLGVLAVVKVQADRPLTRLVALVGVVALVAGVSWVFTRGNSKESSAQVPPNTTTEASNKPELPARGIVPGTTPPKGGKHVVPPLVNTRFSGRFVGAEGHGISSALVYLNDQPIAQTDADGVFHFALPAQFRSLAFGTLECRKTTELGTIRASTELDLSHSSFNLRLKP